MKLLFFDVETNGLPKDYKASYTDLDNWPRVISLAWILADLDGNVINQQHHLIKPDGWEIPVQDFWIRNGYSTEKSLADGVDLVPVLEAFIADKHEASGLVAHNLNFDHRIVWAEIIRAGKEPRSGMIKYCTMMKSTGVCCIPAAKGRGYKWPKLEELYRFLFNKDFEGAHDALADVTACKESFFELVRRGAISIEQPEFS